MGLEIFVGRLAQAHRDDPEEAEFFAEQYEELNVTLARAGQEPHHEPLDYPEDDVFEAQMYGYSGLHTVRRLAAHLAASGVLPEPLVAPAQASKDPVLANRYASDEEPRSRPSLLDRLLGRKPVIREQFSHLINHSDAEGFYVPRELPRVIVDENLTGGYIGSSVRLLAECRIIAAAIELPLSLDPEGDEVFDAAEAPAADGPLWQQYGVESFCLLRLIKAAELSVKHGAVISFG